MQQKISILFYMLKKIIRRTNYYYVCPGIGVVKVSALPDNEYDPRPIGDELTYLQLKSYNIYPWRPMPDEVGVLGQPK